jgi:hypothetical protein
MQPFGGCGTNVTHFQKSRLLFNFQLVVAAALYCWHPANDIEWVGLTAEYRDD